MARTLEGEKRRSSFVTFVAVLNRGEEQRTRVISRRRRRLSSSGRD
jgi:hypothetical protein